MVTYKSRYAELCFYVNGECRRFYLGEYRTEDPAEIAVLNALADAERTDTAVGTKEPEESAVAPKAPRKTSAKQGIAEDAVTSAN